MEGEKPHVLGEQIGVRTAGSGSRESCRAAVPAEGWDGGFVAAAQNNLLVLGSAGAPGERQVSLPVSKGF